jgi:hypothetical protein
VIVLAQPPNVFAARHRATARLASFGLAPLGLCSLGILAPVFAVRPEVHDLLLMNAGKPINPAGKQHHQVDEGAEPAVADQKISRRQQRMEHPYFGLLVGVQRKGQRLEHQPREGVEASLRYDKCNMQRAFVVLLRAGSLVCAAFVATVRRPPASENLLNSAQVPLCP